MPEEVNLLIAEAVDVDLGVAKSVVNAGPAFRRQGGSITPRRLLAQLALTHSERVGGTAPTHYFQVFWGELGVANQPVVEPGSGLSYNQRDPVASMEVRLQHLHAAELGVYELLLVRYDNQAQRDHNQNGTQWGRMLVYVVD